jgi:hypothetical protein
MKKLKTYEMWTTSATSKNFDIKYADNKNIDFIDKPKPIPPKPKPEPTYAKMSKIGKNIVDYIKHYYGYDNYMKSIKKNEIEFSSGSDPKSPKIRKIEIVKSYDDICKAFFTRWKVPSDTQHTIIITENDYDYIIYFLQNLLNDLQKEYKEKEEKEYKQRLKQDKAEIEEVMNDPIKQTGDKYNF